MLVGFHGWNCNRLLVVKSAEPIRLSQVGTTERQVQHSDQPADPLT